MWFSLHLSAILALWHSISNQDFTSSKSPNPPSCHSVAQTQLCCHTVKKKKASNAIPNSVPAATCQTSLTRASYVETENCIAQLTPLSTLSLLLLCVWSLAPVTVVHLLPSLMWWHTAIWWRFAVCSLY